MNRYCFAWLILFVGTLSLSKAQVPFYGVYKSPDHSVVLNVYQTNEQTCYKVYRKKRLVVDESPLGIETSDGSFYTGLKLRSNIKSRTGRENYSLTVGKKSPIKVKYSEITIPLINYQSKEMDLIFRVSNDGVAYRYKLFGKGDCTVFREYSSFKLPSNAKGYLTPLSRPKSGWARTNPSYEEHYVYDVPVGTPSSIGCGWTFPALFEVPGTGWVMLSETGVDGGYCASHLAEDSHGGLYQLEMPGTEDGLYSQSPYPTMSMPASTPWRMMIIGDNPCRIAESTMPTDLVKPLYKAKFDVVPGKASWSWLVLKDDSVTYDVSRKFIDMANQLDFKYCLIDAPWDVQIGREGIEKLAAYAKTRNVGLLLWYNSNGNWNDAPQTPKNIMNKPDSRRDEMKWMQRIGIKGIKVDFFGGDKQFFMRYYQDILTDANDYGLTVNFHGTTLPRGW
ncbi:MAG: glycoside hydrolase family 97 N-terminal domain-containing protein, partial [Bacteroidota bacterium]|nr:glycoside hydrolase family 97 N-terminal domain-containing protein [Bacteroidota bacterium]